MGMPEYEKIRNKRMGLFRRETPRQPPAGPSRLWTFLNSALGIWLLTATFGSLVAATYGSHQACIKEADEKAAKYRRLQAERYSRQSAIHEAITHTQSVADLRARLKTIAETRQEFKDTSLRSLNLDYRDIQNLLRPNDGVSDAVFQAHAYGFVYADRKYLSLTDGILPDDVTDDADFPAIKALALKFSNLLNVASTLSSRYAVVPYCPLQNAFLSLWQSRGPILEYRYQQEYIETSNILPDFKKANATQK